MSVQASGPDGNPADEGGQQPASEVAVEDSNTAAGPVRLTCLWYTDVVLTDERVAAASKSVSALQGREVTVVPAITVTVAQDQHVDADDVGYLPKNGDPAVDVIVVEVGVEVLEYLTDPFAESDIDDLLILCLVDGVYEPMVCNDDGEWVPAATLKPDEEDEGNEVPKADGGSAETDSEAPAESGASE